MAKNTSKPKSIKEVTKKVTKIPELEKADVQNRQKITMLDSLADMTKELVQAASKSTVSKPTPKSAPSKTSSNMSSKEIKEIAKTTSKILDIVKVQSKEIVKIFNKNLKIIDKIYNLEKEKKRLDAIHYNNTYMWFKNLNHTLGKEDKTLQEQLRLLKLQQKDAIVEEEKNREKNKKPYEKDQKDEEDDEKKPSLFTKTYNAVTSPIEQFFNPRKLLNIIGGSIISSISWSLGKFVGLLGKGIPSIFKFGRKVTEEKGPEIISFVKQIYFKLSEISSNIAQSTRESRKKTNTSSIFDTISETLLNISGKMKEKSKGIWSIFLSGLNSLKNMAVSAIGMLTPIIAGFKDTVLSIAKTIIPAGISALSAMSGGISKILSAAIIAAPQIAVIAGIVGGLATIGWQVHEAWSRIKETTKLLQENNDLSKKLDQNIKDRIEQIRNDINLSEQQKQERIIDQQLLQKSTEIDKLREQIKNTYYGPMDDGYGGRDYTTGEEKKKKDQDKLKELEEDRDKLQTAREGIKSPMGLPPVKAIEDEFKNVKPPIIPIYTPSNTPASQARGAIDKYDSKKPTQMTMPVVNAPTNVANIANNTHSTILSSYFRSTDIDTWRLV